MADQVRVAELIFLMVDLRLDLRHCSFQRARKTPMIDFQLLDQIEAAAYQPVDEDLADIRAIRTFQIADDECWDDSDWRAAGMTRPNNRDYIVGRWADVVYAPVRVCTPAKRRTVSGTIG
jgi:hypothetical protein